MIKIYATHGTVSYEDINEIIELNNSVNPRSIIERNNQTVGAISLQLKNHYESNSKRIRFSKGKQRNS